MGPPRSSWRRSRNVAAFWAAFRALLRPAAALLTPVVTHGLRIAVKAFRSPRGDWRRGLLWLVVACLAAALAALGTY